MPITQATATRPPDLHVVVQVANQVRLGQVPADTRHCLADLLVLIDDNSYRLPMPVVAAVDAVIAAFRVSTDPVPPLRTVRVLDRSGAVAAVREVKIPAVCLHCGGPRGEAHEVVTTVHGISMQCDYWDNPCGHVDYARALLVEARRYEGVLA